ncbi:MAG: hypothetical protein ACP59X_12855 [Solidesulfovibrio sp. DCME]|uniref:hypothetical protein n=1 Tax=Solidesulfovibrio sp. DCME TaxID=3447380 RepID=UPI003D0FF028
MPQSNTETEFVNFMHFWEWEYTRRNPQWINIFQEQTSGKNIFTDENGIDFFLINVGPFVGISRSDNMTYYLNPDTIIHSIIINEFNYNHPYRVEYMNEIYNPLHSLLTNSIKKHEGEHIPLEELEKEAIQERDRIYKQLGLDFYTGDRLFSFNVTKGTKDIFFNFVESVIADATKTEDEYQEEWGKYNASVIKKSRGRIGNWKNNEQRAIGLWLFDFCVANNCGGPTAFSAIRQHDYLRPLELSTAIDDDRPLERWLAGTRACVKAGKVLPLVG